MYGRMADAFEARGNAEHRAQLLAGLRGRVVEVGAGTGLNFAHYPREVREVIAVEPEPYLRGRAVEAAAVAPVPVTVVDGTADGLPVDDGSCDAGVVSLVLCSVADVRTALAELYRVIATGGELRFYEHVRANDARLARWQDRLDFLWPRLGGGCHANRRTVEVIEGTGFAIERMRRFNFRPSPLTALTSPHVLGLARRRELAR